MSTTNKRKKNKFTSKRKNIAFVLRTIGLEYDDRVRKEALALSKVANVIIYVNFYNNKKESGITSYGVPYKSFRLKTRDNLPSSKYLLIKAFEFFLQVKRHLKKSDIVWAHEEYTFMFPLLIRRNKCIWDLHEIPFRFENGMMRKVFGFIEKKSIFLIHANKFRIQYLSEIDLIKDEDKHFFINNYPDEVFFSSKKTSEKHKRFKDWLNEDEYAYLQGLNVEGRYPYNSIKSILDSTKLKVVVLGNFDNKSKDVLSLEYGEQLSERVHFVGLEDQLVIPNYLKYAEFSIILYKDNKPNNYYCEPNRLYQSISLNIPVITGDNPPMKDVVGENSFGLVLEDDGEDLNKLKKAVEEIVKNKTLYKSQLESKSKFFRWNNEKVYGLVKDLI